LINFDDLIAAYEEGVKNRYELSLFLEVTEKFLEKAVEYYRMKYGTYYKYKDVVIYFDPLGILKGGKL
jgi:ACT domain-containing protein